MTPRFMKSNTCRRSQIWAKLRGRQGDGDSHLRAARQEGWPKARPERGGHCPPRIGPLGSPLVEARMGQTDLGSFDFGYRKM
jgi:hypothetical protein